MRLRSRWKPPKLRCILSWLEMRATEIMLAHFNRGGAQTMASSVRFAYDDSGHELGDSNSAGGEECEVKCEEPFPKGGQARG